MRGRCIRNDTGLKECLTIGRVYELRSDTDGSLLHYNVTLDIPFELGMDRDADVYRNRFTIIPEELNNRIKIL